MMFTIILIAVCLLDNIKFGSASATFHFIKNTNSCETNGDVCVRKCCPENYVLYNKKCTYENNSEFSPLVYIGEEISDNVTDNVKFAVISANFCRPHEKRLLTRLEDELYLQENGELLRITNQARIYEYRPSNEFCLEIRKIDNNVFWTSIVCMDPDNVYRRHITGEIGK